MSRRGSLNWMTNYTKLLPGCRKYKPAATRGGGDGGAGVKPWRHSFTYYVNSLEFRSRVCLLPGAVVRTRAAQRDRPFVCINCAAIPDTCWKVNYSGTSGALLREPSNLMRVRSGLRKPELCFSTRWAI